MIPHRCLTEAGHHSFVAPIFEILANRYQEETVTELKEADVVVVERTIAREAYGLIQLQMREGKQVWITFDDHYGLIPGTSSHAIWRGGKKALDGRGSILNEFRQGLRMVTGYMTPSKLLCEDFSMYSSNGKHVPNYLSQESWSNLSSPDPNIITVGYGGTNLHNISLKESEVITALGRLSKKYQKFQFHLQPNFEDVIAMCDRAGVRHEIGGWQHFSQWPRTVSQFTIGIAPLSGTYDERRSNLKVLEYAMAGVPWVATRGAPYLEARGGILIDNSAGAWFSAIDELIYNKPLYTRLSQEGKEWALEHNQNCARRYEEIFMEKKNDR